MHEPSILANTLEDLLVREYRTCQNLYNLTKDERLAFTRNDVGSIANLIEHKEALLDELGQIDDQRRMVAQELAACYNILASPPSIAEIAKCLKEETGNRINRLREGVVALTASIRDLTRGNQALATLALERADALQSFLLDLYRPALTYAPPGAPVRTDLDAAWGVDQRT